MSSPLQNKLLSYEVQPPEGLWSKIAISLDESTLHTLSEKLYHYEEAPSTGVWNTINAQLDVAPEGAKIVPFYVRYRRPLKYSGAVAIFLFLAVVTSLLVSKKTESELPAQAVTTTSTKDSFKTPVEITNHPTAQLAEKNTSNRLAVKSKLARTKREEVETSYSLDESFLPRQAERNEMVSSASLSPDKYMIYSDGDGNAIRLPKKIFSAFACPTDDLICKQRLQQLRQKFAASAMTADFTGLLQILKSLQENQ